MSVNIEKVGFWTPIDFKDQPKTWSESALESVDSYCAWGSRKACVISSGVNDLGGRDANYEDRTSSYLATAFKVITYLTIVMPLIAFIAKIILRSLNSFHVSETPQTNPKPNPGKVDFKDMVPTQEEIEKFGEGVEVSDELRKEIEALLPKISQGIYDEKTVVLLDEGQYSVFSLKSAPGIEFKMVNLTEKNNHQPNKMTDDHFINTVKAFKVCQDNNLTALHIPNAKKICLKSGDSEITLIARKHLAIEQNNVAQEANYQKLTGLKVAINQLAIFTLKTGFTQLHPKQIPVLDYAVDFTGDRRIALIGLEALSSPVVGIFGDDTSGGLIGLLPSKEMIHMVVETAKTNTVVPVSDKQKNTVSMKLIQLEAMSPEKQKKTP